MFQDLNAPLTSEEKSLAANYRHNELLNTLKDIGNLSRQNLCIQSRSNNGLHTKCICGLCKD
jgi:hypothetical protein